MILHLYWHLSKAFNMPSSLIMPDFKKECKMLEITPRPIVTI